MEEGVQNIKKSGGGKILIAGTVAFVLVAIAAWFLCDFRMQYISQSILNRQRDMEQAHISKTLDNIRVWAAEVVSQMRLVSTSDMFRLFIADTSALDAEALENLAKPDSLHSPDEGVRMLAEQHAYIQDLLQDLTQRRAWSEARIVNAKGHDIVSENFAQPLTEAQAALVEASMERGRAAFGPVRQSEHGYVMDIADPLFEVMGINEPTAIAALLVTVPMDRTLSTFLMSTGEHGGSIGARIIDRGQGVCNLIFLRGNFLQMQAVTPAIEGDEYPFEERKALAGSGEVYSMGSPTIMMNWLFVAETSAAVIQDEIDSEKTLIYSLGAGASLLAALLGALAWWMFTSHTHKARAQELEKLYETINQQKLLLDGINGSVRTGVLLVDNKGFIKVANPAFCEICGVEPGTAKDLPLPEVMRGEPSIILISEMVKVREENTPKSIELTMPAPDGEKRLYRVNLFPYAALPGENSTSGNGCVAIFQDITSFRASAKRAKQRQEALIRAMDRAVASVDPNLVGQSLKMSRLSQLIADKLGLDPNQKETLRLSAMLSQIGKLFVPRELLRKKGPLTSEERKEVARAPEYADNILHDLHFGLPVQQTVREMNERMDGSGPKEMKGEEISVCGRVLGVASALVAMTSPRAWRSANALSLQDAIEALTNDSRFDEEVTAALNHIDMAALIGAMSNQEEAEAEAE